MPHITIEHSADLANKWKIAALFDAIERAYSDSAIIVPQNIKMRAISCDHFRVAGGAAPFAHITITMMEGPTETEKQALSDKIFNAACDALAPIRHVTLDIRDMDPVTYRKRTADWAPAL